MAHEEMCDGSICEMMPMGASCGAKMMAEDGINWLCIVWALCAGHRGAQRTNTHNVRRQLCEKGSGQESEHERCSHNLRAAVEGGAQCTPMIVVLQPCNIPVRSEL